MIRPMIPLLLVGGLIAVTTTEASAVVYCAAFHQPFNAMGIGKGAHRIRR